MMTRPTGERHNNLPDRDVEAQLPWYVNQTLAEPERAEVESHLASSPELRDKLAQWQRLAEGVRAVEVPAPEPSTEGFAALMAQIDAVASPVPAPDVSPGIWARLGEGWQSFRLNWIDTPGSARLALGLQCALIVLCIVGITLPWPWSTPKVYRALTDERPAAVAPGRQIRLVLADAMTAGELRELLGRAQATIINGPSPLGVYTLAVRLDATQPNVMQRTLQMLRTHAHVTLAEPIAGRGRTGNSGVD